MNLYLSGRALLTNDIHDVDRRLGRWEARAFRSIDIAVDAAARRVILAGEIDMADADGLRDLLVEVAGALGAVEVDLREVRFIDSAGCRALVQAAAAARERGGEIRAVTVEGPVRRVFRLLGIEERLSEGSSPADG